MSDGVALGRNDGSVVGVEDGTVDVDGMLVGWDDVDGMGVIVGAGETLGLGLGRFKLTTKVGGGCSVFSRDANKSPVVVSLVPTRFSNMRNS